MTAVRALLTLAAVVAATSVMAANLQALDLDQLVQLSDEIVVGRVVASETRWQGKVIVTVATIEVEETIKGEGAARLEITQLGGTAVHARTGLSVTMTASTQVALTPGDDVLLFVSRLPGETRQLVGAQQGRLSIRENPQTRVREIPVGPKRLEVLRGAERDRVATKVLTLEDMRERIRARLRLGGSRP